MTEPGGAIASDPVAAFLTEQSRAGAWPGAVWWVEERGRVASAGATGLRAVVPDRLPALTDTIYDLASLTKPLATAALLAMLEEEGLLALDDPAAAWLPGLVRDGAGGDGPSLLDLALHSSGLPAWRPFYGSARTREEILELVLRLEPEAPCGSRVLYSDPGYILLGEILVRASGRPLDTLFRERVASPLGLMTLCFRPPAEWKDRIAPTELGNRHEREKALELAERPRAAGSPAPPVARPPSTSIPQGSVAAVAATGSADAGLAADLQDPSRFRDALIHGEVHDGNAHALGGVAGHAGLFGECAEVVRLAREFLGAGTGLFGPRALARFRENRTPGLDEGRTVGWKRAVAGAREASGVLPEESFGHSGFTGTSVWLDPLGDRLYVLLTNRVHPEVRATDMTALRRRFHEIASRLFS